MSRGLEDFQLADAIHRLWKASGASATVTGGLHRGRVPTDQDKPYAVLKIAPADEGVVLSSPGSDNFAEYTHASKVTVEVFAVGQEAAAMGAAEVAALFDDETELVIPGATVLQILPQPSLGELQPELVAGEDVWKASLTVTIVVEHRLRVPA